MRRDEKDKRGWMMADYGSGAGRRALAVPCGAPACGATVTWPQACTAGRRSWSTWSSCTRSRCTSSSSILSRRTTARPIARRPIARAPTAPAPTAADPTASAPTRTAPSCFRPRRALGVVLRNGSWSLSMADPPSTDGHKVSATVSRVRQAAGERRAHTTGGHAPHAHANAAWSWHRRHPREEAAVIPLGIPLAVTRPNLW